MFLLARMSEGKISAFALLGIVATLVLLAAAPIILIRELRRRPDEKLPEWMGTVRGRRIRLAIILGVLGLVIGGLVVWGQIAD